MNGFRDEDFAEGATNSGDAAASGIPAQTQSLYIEIMACFSNYLIESSMSETTKFPRFSWGTT